MYIASRAQQLIRDFHHICDSNKYPGMEMKVYSINIIINVTRGKFKTIDNINCREGKGCFQNK
jgi:hypothetical protein